MRSDSERSTSNTNEPNALHFVVVGAGIAGLTTAYLLKQAGHNVTVLEKFPRDVQKDGGLRVPPNMTRLLLDFSGAKALLETKASKCAGLFFRQGGQADLLGKMSFMRELMTDLGSDFYLIPYADLHDFLYSLCLHAGIQIRHNFETEKVYCAQDSTASVVSKTGERVTADIVIGADGVNSAVRQALLDQPLSEEDEDTDEDTASNFESSTFPPLKEITVASISLPASLFKVNTEIESTADQPEHWNVLFGDKRLALSGLHGPNLLVLGLVLLRSPLDDTDLSWLSGETATTLLKYMDNDEVTSEESIDLARTVHWSVQTAYNLPRYSCKYNTVIPVGDAAHSVPINGTQNTAAAFEDAFTLGRLFSQEASRSRSKHALLLNGYNQIQRARISELEVAEMDAYQTAGLPPGPARDQRDKGFAATLNLDGADDETLANVLSTYVTQFNYDAREAVDEWWMNWGKPTELY